MASMLLRACISSSISTLSHQLSRLTCGAAVASLYLKPQFTVSRNFCALAQPQLSRPHIPVAAFTSAQPSILSRYDTLLQKQPSRTVTKFSLTKGKRKSVKAVLLRFYRLHNGLWIRPRAGRHKRLWRKSADRKYRLRQHVFCTKSQCKMLGKMVTKYWKKPKYYIDDPYEPYHTRNNCSFVYKKDHPF